MANIEEFEAAVRSGRLSDVKSLLAESPDLLNVEISDGSPFELALQLGFTKILDYFIDSGLLELDPKGKSPLRLCLNYGYLRQATRLLELGANPNSRNESEPSLLLLAISKGLFNIASELLNQGAEINARDERGWTALIHASFRGWGKAVDFLLDNGAAVNICNKDGWNSLVAAFAKGHKDIADKLLSCGGVFGPSYASAALVSAYKSRDLTIVKTLLEQGVSPECAVNDKDTLLGQSVLDGEWSYAELFIKFGANPNIVMSNGCSLLQKAVISENINFTQTLIKKGVSLNFKGTNGVAALHYAVAYNTFANITDLLLKNGADVNVRTKEGLMTPLMVACQKRNEGMARFLVSKDACRNLESKDGKKAYEYAPYSWDFVK